MTQLIYSIAILAIATLEGLVIFGILFGVIFAMRIAAFYRSRSPDEMVQRFYLVKPFRLNSTHLWFAAITVLLVFATMHVKSDLLKMAVDPVAKNHVDLPLEWWLNCAGLILGLLLGISLGRLLNIPLHAKCRNLPKPVWDKIFGKETSES